ncbi:hypothetical protein FISHEDRAFT_62532 [Fistulina hepatica ATCC 64428]|nr:hypothetical protein FISHEDRAFT_62532 [Fistulina hepatica ATCC 64428]
MDLDERQRQAVAQLKDLTNNADDEVAVGVLESVNWDVQRAAELIFDHPPSASAASSSNRSLPAPVTSSEFQRFDIDDSAAPPRPVAVRQPSILAFVTFPFRILVNVVRFIFNVLHIPFPQFTFRLSGLTFYSPLRRSRLRRRGSVESWVHELEEETGAVCFSSATSEATGVEPGPSSASLTQRRPADDRKLLPDFTPGTYEDIVKLCRDETRIGMIILVSEEHDDVAEFKRTTLTDRTLVNLLHDNNVVVWGGDVCDREPFSAAQKLQATTYPFVAFVAMQPRRLAASNAPASQLTVLSRHQGPPVPSSSPTSPQTLITYLNDTLLPRVQPYLATLRSQREAQQRQAEQERLALMNERRLREEQDRAFAESTRRDKERILARMAEETREREQKAQEALLEEERRKAAVAEAEAQLHWKTERLGWRRWLRRSLLPFLAAAGARGGTRIAFRMPSGTRAVHVFPPGATLTSVYAAVDIQFIPQDALPSEDPLTPPGSSAPFTLPILNSLEQVVDRRALGHTAFFPFTLHLAYPRVHIPWRAQTRLSDVDALHGDGGAQIVVEMRADRTELKAKLGSAATGHASGNTSRASLTNGTDGQRHMSGSDDEYLTESSDEE